MKDELELAMADFAGDYADEASRSDAVRDAELLLYAPEANRARADFLEGAGLPLDATDRTDYSDVVAAIERHGLEAALDAGLPPERLDAMLSDPAALREAHRRLAGPPVLSVEALAEQVVARLRTSDLVPPSRLLGPEDLALLRQSAMAEVEGQSLQPDEALGFLLAYSRGIREVRKENARVTERSGAEDQGKAAQLVGVLDRQDAELVKYEADPAREEVAHWFRLVDDAGMSPDGVAEACNRAGGKVKPERVAKAAAQFRKNANEAKAAVSDPRPKLP